MATLSSDAVAENTLYENLDYIIKNKKYAINGYTTKKKMDNMDVSTVADSADLEENDLNIYGVEYYKTIPFSPKRFRDFNVGVYKVLDYNLFIERALFNGWLLTPCQKYAVKASNLPSYYFRVFDIYICRNKLID